MGETPQQQADRLLAQDQERRRMPSSRIICTGRDWTQPTATTSMQREKADPPLLPMAREFNGRWRYGTWAACFAVVTLLICALLS